MLLLILFRVDEGPVCFLFRTFRLFGLFGCLLNSFRALFYGAAQLNNSLKVLVGFCGQLRVNYMGISEKRIRYEVCDEI